MRDAILSAFSQDYSNLEIIIVDDGSTDQTVGIIKDLVSKYSGPHKVKLFLKELNCGLADSVNSAIYDLAEGEWLIFAAGDDISKPFRTKEVASIATNQNKITCVQGAVTLVNENLEFIGSRTPKSNNICDLHRLTVCGASASYRRDAVTSFPRIGKSVRNEDFVLTSRALLKGLQAESKSESVLWRRHQENLTAKLSSTGEDYSLVPLSLLQQVADVCFIAANGEMDSMVALHAVDCLLLSIKRIEKRLRFQKARRNWPTFFKYLTTSPFEAFREIGVSAYLTTLILISHFIRK